MNNNTYYTFGRNELEDLVPAKVERILDLGCGGAVFSGNIKKKQKCAVVGIDNSRKAISIARSNIDYTIQADLNTFDFSSLKTDFDLLILNDVIEHLKCPLCVIKNAIKKLTPNGQIIASIPNIAHPDIKNQLEKGLFRYTSAGILDRTHLRFFTQTTIFQFFSSLDLKIKYIRPYPSKENPIQYHILAHKIKPKPAHPKTTIITLSYNCLEYTKLFVETLQRNTKEPFKLIIVDNNSTDGTQEWLRQQPWIYHIENTSNLGFACGNNIALELVDTEYFVLANNDIIFTPKWLKTMLSSFAHNPKYGIVGPVSNNVSGPQKIECPKYTCFNSMFEFAKSLQKETNPELENFHRIVFFCTIFKSILLKQVGYLDEQFGLGNFEDDDYCLRALKAGFISAINKSCFIHHYGSRTWLHNKIDYNKQMERNKQLFGVKHGLRSSTKIR